jgi:hypothetical protein
MTHFQEQILLVYCIFDLTGDGLALIQRGIEGVDGLPVQILEHNGLGAVISRLPGEWQEQKPNVSQILRYEKVVEALYQDRAVLPMRYGSIWKEEATLKKLLEQKKEYYQALLKKVENCCEMSIRVILERKRESEETEHTLLSGTSYLKARQKHYTTQEQEENALTTRFLNAFQGLFVEHKTERSATLHPIFSAPYFSFYFLIQRDKKEQFMHTFHSLKQQESPKMLLSGPWPPYNFC